MVYVYVYMCVWAQDKQICTIYLYYVALSKK